MGTGCGNKQHGINRSNIKNGGATRRFNEVIVEKTKQAAVKKPEVKLEKEIEIGKKSKVAIVGFADSKVQAPFDDKDFEIWSINECWSDKAIKRVDVIFELHDLAWIKEGKRIKEHYTWLKNNKEIAIIMQKHFLEIPMSVPYPLDDIVKKYGNYFTNTISEMIALAMEIGFKEIHLYGVNMATDTEYGAQRPSVEYFVGLARGKGITVYIPSESDLLKNFYIYGFEDGELSVMAQKLKSFINDQDGKVNFFQGRINNDTAGLHQAIGAKTAVNYIMQSFIYPNGNFPEEE